MVHIMNIKLGFSTGAFYKHLSISEAIIFIKNAGCNAVELGFVKMNNIEEQQLLEITAEDLNGFEFVSFHAPKINYGKNKETEDVFEKIKRIDSIRKLDIVVFHPDSVEDFDIFDNLSFNIGFENMDNRSDLFKNPQDFKELFSKNKGHKLIVDLNHIYANDRSMKLAGDFYKELGDRINEIHLSGCLTGHQPLFETKQLEILEAMRDFNTPIIIESILQPQDLIKEKNYILDFTETKLSRKQKQ